MSLEVFLFVRCNGISKGQTLSHSMQLVHLLLDRINHLAALDTCSTTLRHGFIDYLVSLAEASRKAVTSTVLATQRRCIRYHSSSIKLED